MRKFSLMASASGWRKGRLWRRLPGGGGTGQHASSDSKLAKMKRNELLFRESANQAQASRPQYSTIQGAFENQAKVFANRTALRWEDETFTYKELNELANKLAHQIVGQGIKPGDLVGLFFERSAELMVAVLATLKAGAAYVPLDPSSPRDRRNFMLSDAGTKVLLTHEALLGELGGIEVPKIFVDLEKLGAASQREENLGVEIEENSVAYVIYTSGSTGHPKGVLVSHRNVLRLMRQTEHWYGFDESDVWTLFHSYAFDFSVWEMWGALLYGGTLVVVPYLCSRNPDEFVDLVVKEKVTVLNQTPSAFRQFVAATLARPGIKNTSLRYVIFGGEALELQSLAPWFERFGYQKPRLVNMYGITETTVHVTYRAITEEDLRKGAPSVIGEPIPDLEIHLLDENLQRVTNGEAGEICVAGAGVAMGYLRRPELTAERFIDHPLAGSGKLYRSGDLGRRLADGDLAYLGRKDSQVKIRGFRIELGEIEAALNKQASIRESVVTVHDGGDGQKRLIAHVVCSDAKANAEGLKISLRGALPEYMVPAQIVFLPRLPLTVNGKVDRRALPAPPQERPQLETAFQAPQNDREAKLVQIWEEVLEITGVGVADNFFDLGGDSIRSIQIMARVREAGWDMSLRDLFESPTIKGLADRLVKAKAAARKLEPFALVEALDRKRLPGDLEDAYPTVQLQEGMLFHSEMNRQSAVFHDIFSFRLERPFEAALFKQALNMAVARHTILRTSFDLGGFSHPIQLVHRNVDAPLSWEDLKDRPAKEQVRALENWIEQEKRRPLDWTKPPVARFHVQVYGENEFQFIFSFHHAILDGWSLAAVVTEIFQDYAALLGGSVEPRPELKLKYRDFVALERQATKSEAAREFWKTKLAGAQMHTLPRWPRAMRPGGTEQVRGPEIFLKDEILEKLRHFAKSEGVPLRTVLLAAHFKVMQTLASHEDIVSGLISNGRPEALDGEKLIGLYLNAVPVRVGVEASSWQELVRKVFREEQELLPHRRVPLSEIQQIAGGRALYETAFDFVHFHVYKNLQGSKTAGFNEGHYFEANNFTLLTTFMLDVTSKHLQMHFDYDPEQICAEQIELMCGYYVATLETMAADPSARHETFSPLSAAERTLLLEEWNNTEKPFRREACIHELVKEQAERTPEAIAVIAGERTLTYEEVNSEANRLAHQLRALGVRPGTYVAVHLSRKPELIIALLAVLKAGGAYVPLEPAYPEARIQYILKNLDCKTVISETSWKDRFEQVKEDYAGLENLVLMDVLNQGGQSELRTFDRVAWVENPKENVNAPVCAGDIAYVIFTSGSTGAPKGVVVRHQPVINLIEWVNSTFKVGEGDCLLFVTSPCFDLSVYDIFGTLACGGAIRIASEEELKDPERLLNIMLEERITFWDSAPAALLQLAPLIGAIGTGTSAKAHQGNTSSLRLVFLSGDWIPVSLPDEVRKVFTRSEIISLGGATEAAIWSNYYPIGKVDPAWPSIPYGKPIQNARYHVLDKYLNPVPRGVAGDLYIGGDCLASGYCNDEELTRAKFIADPFHGGMLYKTGDLARYFPDGNLEFLGRSDFQVKVRGFRIELGEIETVLRKNSQVQEAVVVARQDLPGDKRLVAYVRPKGEPPSLESLRDQVRAELPDYMMPAAFIIVEQFPVTPNGKMDRNALPKPDWNIENRAFVGPRTPVEKVLAAVWSEVLGIERIGLNDDFLELGGHSLLAIQLVSRLREAFMTDIPLRTLMQAPTIGRFAEAILSVEAEPGRLERTAGMWLEISKLSEDELESRMGSTLEIEKQEVMG